MAAVKLSTTLIIVIAVSGSLGCAIVLFLTFKCCRRSKSVPLPPIQPLAHRREKDINCLPRPYIPRDELGQLGRYGSDTSLLKPSRKRSFQTDESHGTPSSSQHSFPVGPSPPTNVTHQPSPLSVESFSDEQTSVTHQYTPTTQQVRSSSRVRPRQSRSRTNSAGSTHISLTHVSTRSGNTIHGAPHSNRSNVQIVLPTPLAPQLLDHMVTNPSMVGNYEELAERGGIADGWTPAPGRITSQRSNTGQDLSKRDGRKTSSSSGHRLRRSLDTMDRPGRSESQTQFRGRTSSHRRIQPQPLSHGDTTASPWTLDNKTQPRRVTLQKPRDRQAGQLASEQGNRPSSHSKANPRSQSLSLSRPHQSPSDTPNLPFHPTLSHSLQRHTPSSSANTLIHHSTLNNLPPPPVPTFPQLPQKPLTKPQHTPPRRSNSIPEP